MSRPLVWWASSRLLFPEAPYSLGNQGQHQSAYRPTGLPLRRNPCLRARNNQLPLHHVAQVLAQASLPGLRRWSALITNATTVDAQTIRTNRPRYTAHEVVKLAAQFRRQRPLKQALLLVLDCLHYKQRKITPRTPNFKHKAQAYARFTGKNGDRSTGKQARARGIKYTRPIEHISHSI